MSAKDFHEEAYDEGTVLKLNILEHYLTEWLPVFLHGKTQIINIFDFHCGPGKDCSGEAGSPLRIVRVVRKYIQELNSKGVKVKGWFNDIEPGKIVSCQNCLSSESAAEVMESHFTNNRFEEIFPKACEEMRRPGSANFVFIDPTGLVPLREVSPRLALIPKTDVLIFAPAQHIARLARTEEFQKYLPGFPVGLGAREVPSALCEYIKGSMPSGEQTYHHAPFAIRKGRNSNIYALIFGSGNLLGLVKFLTVTWKISPNGEANYDLAGDLAFKDQYALEGFDTPRKIATFRKELRALVLEGVLRNNLDVSIFRCSCKNPMEFTTVACYDS